MSRNLFERIHQTLFGRFRSRSCPNTSSASPSRPALPVEGHNKSFCSKPHYFHGEDEEEEDLLQPLSVTSPNDGPLNQIFEAHSSSMNREERQHLQAEPSNTILNEYFAPLTLYDGDFEGSSGPVSQEESQNSSVESKHTIMTNDPPLQTSINQNPPALSEPGSVHQEEYQNHHPFLQTRVNDVTGSFPLQASLNQNPPALSEPGSVHQEEYNLFRPRHYPITFSKAERQTSRSEPVKPISSRKSKNTKYISIEEFKQQPLDKANYPPLFKDLNGLWAYRESRIFQKCETKSEDHQQNITPKLPNSLPVREAGGVVEELIVGFLRQRKLNLLAKEKGETLSRKEKDQVGVTSEEVELWSLDVDFWEIKCKEGNLEFVQSTNLTECAEKKASSSSKTNKRRNETSSASKTNDKKNSEACPSNTTQKEKEKEKDPGAYFLADLESIEDYNLLRLDSEILSSLKCPLAFRKLEQGIQAIVCLTKPIDVVALKRRLFASNNSKFETNKTMQGVARKVNDLSRDSNEVNIDKKPILDNNMAQGNLNDEIFLFRSEPLCDDMQRKFAEDNSEITFGIEPARTKTTNNDAPIFLQSTNSKRNISKARSPNVGDEDEDIISFANAEEDTKKRKFGNTSRSGQKRTKLDTHIDASKAQTPPQKSGMMVEGLSSLYRSFQK